MLLIEIFEYNKIIVNQPKYHNDTRLLALALYTLVFVQCAAVPEPLGEGTLATRQPNQAKDI